MDLVCLCSVEMVVLPAAPFDNWHAFFSPKMRALLLSADLEEKDSKIFMPSYWCRESSPLIAYIRIYYGKTNLFENLFLTYKIFILKKFSFFGE
jgi:hypothetical protein